MFGRIRTAAAVPVSYFAALVPLLLFGWEGIWWAKILTIGSAPLLAIATLTAFLFAGPIRERPFAWSGAAALISVLASVVALWFITDTLVGVVAVPVVALASAIFIFAVKAFNPSPEAGS